MRKLAFAFALAALFVGTAQAAQVDIVAKETAPGNWELQYTSAVPLESINITACGVAELAAGPYTCGDFAVGHLIGIDFTFDPGGPANIAFSFPPPVTEFGIGGLAISASRGLATDPALPAGVDIVLGTFSGDDVADIIPDIVTGGTVFLDGLTTPSTDFSLMVMALPEPGSIILMGLALGGLAFARRRA
ncbi:MAG: PEP-CTERM sorting domain-containing protein [Acidimicrobiia bacterium]